MAQKGGDLPLKSNEVLNLVGLGINADIIKFKNVTMMVPKYITVNNERDNKLSIINTENRQIMNLNLRCDSAIMNPATQVLGFRTEKTLQILNLEMRTKMKNHTMNDSVSFWKWINKSTIAIVDDKSVYHWSMDGDAIPEKIFDRAHSDTPVQIINYSVSTDGKWCLLNGITGKDGEVVGFLQLYSVDRKQSQPTLPSHSGCFSNITLEGRDSSSVLFCMSVKGADGHKVIIAELSNPPPGKPQHKIASALSLSNPSDFPVSMLADDSHGCIWILSKLGYLYLYELTTAKMILAKQASNKTMFLSVSIPEKGGILTVDTTGKCVRFSIDESTIVPYICSSLNEYDMGIKLASRYNLPGAENLFKTQFEKLMNDNNVPAAAKLAVEAPQGILRTPDTIARFKRLPTPPGGRAPLLQYFALLLDKGKLNSIESFELCRPLLEAGNKQHIEKWLNQEKLEYSEDLGNLIMPYDPRMACMVYYKAKVPEKVIGCFLQMGNWDKVIQYAKGVGFTPDYLLLLQQLHRISRDDAKKFALQLASEETGTPLIDPSAITDVFLNQNDFETATSFLLDVLKLHGDREADGPLQTKLLEINLVSMPEVASAIMESSEFRFTHYNRNRIASLCERAQLYQKALENYESRDDRLRVIVNANQMDSEFVLNFMGRVPVDERLEALRTLLKFNISQYIRLVIEIAKRYSDDITPAKLIALFEEFKSPQGLYYYLGSFVNQSDDPLVIMKYIQAAAKINVSEVERICRDNEFYNPVEVKDFLIKENLKDPRPLIHVCDRFKFIPELTRHLYNNTPQSGQRFIEVYVQKMSPSATPLVIGSLLDLNAPEEFIKNLLSLVPAQTNDSHLTTIPSAPQFCPIDELVAEVGKRGRLRLILPWLEARLHEGITDPALHNALAQIYVDMNMNPVQFLTNNQYYDSKVVGKFCESINPVFSVIAYKRANGACDNELIEVTNKHGFFKDQSRYLVQRQSKELWETVLSADNPYRREVIDQVVATALPESKLPDEVSVTVQAFMKANMPNELIELLEKIVLYGSTDSTFHNNKNLQNLLILTAIKADPKRVMDYINRMDHYDGPDIAKIAIYEQYKLYEEAFVIYQKFKRHNEAINVLIHNIEDLERATDFADIVNEPAVWSLLGSAQLDNQMIVEAIASFLKANDPSSYETVIIEAENAKVFDKLIPYLKMARETIHEEKIDDELIICYATTEKLSYLEDFISGANNAKVEAVGDRCLANGLYLAAKILFTHAGVNSKLAVTLLALKQYVDACEAARKANDISTWRTVCYACVDVKEFRLAQICGLQIIRFMDNLTELIKHYERGGYFDQVITLLEQGILLDQTHQGMFTSLGILYAKYKEEKLMEHCKVYFSRINIPQLLQVCKEQGHWKVVVFLFVKYDQFDNAIDAMIQHSAECFVHQELRDVIIKVSNSDVYFRTFDFYLAEHPLLLNELLIDLAGKINHSRVVQKMRTANALPLVFNYLLHVQHENISDVNEAINDLYLEEENHTALRESIEGHSNFDSLSLAKRLEKHELLAFRRIAASLYKMNKRYEKSMEISRNDNQWTDCMNSVADSKSVVLATELLSFFVKSELKECFSACLYTCYDLLNLDYVIELAWRNNLMDFAYPFIIQSTKDLSERVKALEVKMAENMAEAEANKKKAEESAESHIPILGAGYPLPLALPPPGYIPQQY